MRPLVLDRVHSSLGVSCQHTLHHHLFEEVLLSIRIDTMAGFCEVKRLRWVSRAKALAKT